MLQLRTFGGLSVQEDGAPCRGAAVRRRTLALLALLAAADKNGASRDKLIAFLWPESDADHGRNLLRQACFSLRRDLYQPALILGTTELRLNPEALSSDVHAFADALERGDLAGAVALYGGPFLDGFYLKGADEFERWVDAERVQLKERVCRALETLATGATARGDHRAAADWWRRLAALDPLSSRAAVGLMTALAATGEVAEALQHGRAYDALVREELGTAPEAALGELTKRLRLEPAAAEGVTVEDLRLGTSATRRRTVGYEKERAALRGALESAIAGRGSMVCVSGEAGSGKTTLAEDFLGELVASGRPYHVARGRCSERLSGTGAYLPLLDALEGLLHSDARGAVTQLLRQLAPNWYAQIAPVLIEEASAAKSTPQVQLASQERLKRELHAFLHELCRLRPLVVFFDDVHWVDASTVDILGYVADRIGTTQMLLLVSYRPSELLLAKHPFGPLKLELQTRGLCTEVGLELLTRRDIEQFLTLEFPGHRFPPSFAAFVHAKTEGSPLFMVDLLRYLRARSVIIAENGGWKLAGSVPALDRELPESVRSMIERKIEQLGDADLQVLIVAGVQGYEFDSPVVAKVLETDLGEFEERVETLGRIHGFVRRLRELELPDGTAGVRYRFVHVLYQNALYARLAPTRRATLSRAIADALLVHYGERRGEIAAELAFLLEAARDTPRAAQYFALAAERAASVFAHREAVVLAKRGLGLLSSLPDTPARAGQELGLQLTLGFSVFVTNGYADPDAERSMARAREICHNLGEMPQLFPAIYGLWGFYLVGAQMRASREMAEQLVRMAERAQDPVLLHGAHAVMGSSLQQLGELPAAAQHLEHAVALYDPRQHDGYRAVYRQVLAPYAMCESLRVLWLLGYPDRAQRRHKDATALALSLGDRQAAGWPLLFGAILHQHRGEAEPSRKYAEQCLAHATEHGMVAHQRWAATMRAWAVAELGALQDGIAEMQESLAAQRATDQIIVFPYFLGILAEILGKAGQIVEARDAIREGLQIVAATDQHFYEAELHRLAGELLLQGPGAVVEAEAYFREALSIAGRQEAKSLELRAAMSLGRLWREQGKKDAARNVLTPVYSWFTEGFDTADLQDARELLDELV